MQRLFVAFSLAFCACMTAGCGGSSLHQVGDRLSLQQDARDYSKEWLGDPHPGITHVETVRLAYGARAAVVEMAGHFTINPLCPGAGRCPIEHPRHVVLALSLLHPKNMLGEETTSVAQLATIARARHAQPALGIFPDFATEGVEGVRCTIPRGTPPGGVVPGICLTQDEPYPHSQDSPYRHPTRVEFTERWPLTRRIHSRSEAVWIVTFNRSGHIQSIRVTGHPPQLRK